MKVNVSKEEGNERGKRKWKMFEAHGGTVEKRIICETCRGDTEKGFLVAISSGIFRVIRFNVDKTVFVCFLQWKCQ